MPSDLSLLQSKAKLLFSSKAENTGTTPTRKWPISSSRNLRQIGGVVPGTHWSTLEVESLLDQLVPLFAVILPAYKEIQPYEYGLYHYLSPFYFL